ncbi:hypothetical protein GO755_04815 [Spirosoma sp. HMF4905]|uniref:Uncharacterized protein n=1 Tax=Spirosoma arboris TaxID=2682092 RepID=A0A7K1S6H9_9BACT|nr:hypothetical protein [Spirosoma arboris]MVM29345.1 hypothetical protein [Spirosoma arboris]
MSDSIFNENAGRFLSTKENLSMKEAYRASKLACGHKENDYTRSEFFGLNRITELLKQPGCVGIRVHYANRWEDEDGKPTEPGRGKLNSRALLTGVDSSGRDLLAYAGHGGLKDDAGDGNNSGAVGDGYTCPQHCGNSN